MRNNRVILLTIFSIVFVNFIGYGIIFPILPLVSKNFGANDFLATILVGMYPLFQFLSAPILGTLSDRYGRKPLLLFSLFGTAISFLIMARASNLIILYLGRILDGVSGGNITIAQAYVADISSKKERSSAMGIISMGLALGFTIGPVIGGFFGNFSYAAPLYIGFGLSLLTIILTFFLLSESLTVKTQKKALKILPFKEMMQVVLIPELTKILIVLFIFSVTVSSIFTTFALFLEEKFYLGSFASGLFFGLRGIFSFLALFLLLARAIKLLGEKKVLRLCLLIYIIGLFITGISSSLILFTMALIAIEGGSSLIRPIIYGMVSKRVDSSIQGEILGMVQSISAFGRIVGPFIGGLSLQFLGPSSVYFLATIIMVLTVLYLQYLLKPKYSLLTNSS